MLEKRVSEDREMIGKKKIFAIIVEKMVKMLTYKIFVHLTKNASTHLKLRSSC